ncbi:hypothetical protein BpHYR1_029542 [Brachionus plicatilis]|uniref:Uncharacterized protein n=1 Tax=Brachionus plicatilis TaxID=10195 RepID=A0A3M7R7V3_BRAPC|nr:hypothetical protein BpHYR1_029542 [Brachionus plicatilis]
MRTIIQKLLKLSEILVKICPESTIIIDILLLQKITQQIFKQYTFDQFFKAKTLNVHLFDCCLTIENKIPVRHVSFHTIAAELLHQIY